MAAIPSDSLPSQRIVMYVPLAWFIPSLILPGILSFIFGQIDIASRPNEVPVALSTLLSLQDKTDSLMKSMRLFQWKYILALDSCLHALQIINVG